MGYEHAASLGMETPNDLATLFDTLLRLDLALQFTVGGLELLQHKFLRLYHLGRFISCNDGYQYEKLPQQCKRQRALTLPCVNPSRA
mgnify:CR=1 FL=1